LFDLKTEEIEKATGCNIHWTSQDKNPTIKLTTKKIKKGKKVETKKIEKTVKSFFDFFNDHDKGDLVAGDDGAFIKDDLIPNALEYYLDILAEEDDYDDDFDGEDDGDDDEEDSPSPKKNTKAKGKAAPTGGAAAGKDEKCKNQ